MESGLGHHLSRFARRLLSEWRRTVAPVGDGRIVIAVSGGADSCALLLAVWELVKSRRLDLSVVVAHLDHGLRGEEAAADAAWVLKLAGGLGYECRVGRAEVADRAHRSGDNLEQAARGERYEFLARTAREQGARYVLTGHTLDDQAETVLLALLRGSGAEGLSGMPRTRALDEGGDVSLARPLLGWARRADTEAYCREQCVEPRRDAMNEDERYRRVRVRRQLIPLLETFNPRAVEALARAADLLREDAASLDGQAAKLLEAAIGDPDQSEEIAPAGMAPARVDRQTDAPAVALTRDEQGPVWPLHETRPRQNSSDTSRGVAASGNKAAPLSVEVLRGAHVATRRRTLRRWLRAGRGSLRRIESVHVLAIEKLLEGERGGRVAQLPGGAEVVRRRGYLWFYVKGQTESIAGEHE